MTHGRHIKSLDFEYKGGGPGAAPGDPHDVWVAFIEKVHEDQLGVAMAVQEAIRVVAEPGGGYRVDFAGSIASTWLPWEPVSTKVYETFEAAAKAASLYAAGLLRE